MPGPINLGGDAVADFAASLAQASTNVGEKPPEADAAEAVAARLNPMGVILPALTDDSRRMAATKSDPDTPDGA
jgi:hypothetical protein